MSKKKKLLSDQIPEVGRRLTKFTGRQLIDRVGQDVIVKTHAMCRDTLYLYFEPGCNSGF